MSNGIIEAVDFRMQALARQADQSKDASIQMTVRIPETLKIKLDVLSDFMGGTRNSLLVEFLEIACKEAIERIENNPYVSELKVKDKSISEAIAEAMKGEELEGFNDVVHAVDIGLSSPDKLVRKSK
jgi:predicted DNA-binding protein